MNITSGYWGSRTHLGGGEFADRLSGAPFDIINPNELGFVIVTTLPFLYYFLWKSKFFNKMICLGLMTTLMYALILTLSRGSFIALLVVGWMIFKSSNRKFFLLLSFFVMAVAALSVMNDDQKDRYLSLVDSDTKGAATTEGRWRGMQRTRCLLQTTLRFVLLTSALTMLFSTQT